MKSSGMRWFLLGLAVVAVAAAGKLVVHRIRTCAEAAGEVDEPAPEPADWTDEDRLQPAA